MFEREKYGGVKCHNTEEWCEIEEELNCALKSDMGNLANFELTLECLKICTFEKFALLGSFWEKYIMSELKKFQKSYVSWDWRVMQYLKKNLLAVLKNGIRNLINFHEISRESEDFHFDGLALSKAYKVLDEKIQKCNVSSHLRVIQRKDNSWEIYIFCVMQ